MYRISEKVLIFVMEVMKNWKVDLRTVRKTLAEVETQRDIFQGDSLSPLLFVIDMMPLNHILRKCTRGSKYLRRNKRLIT